MRHVWRAIWVWGLIFSAQTARADWTPAKRITWTSGVSIHPAITIDPSKTLHVVWYDNTPGNSEIYYKKSTDGGSNWSVSQRLTWTAGASSDPAIAIGMDNSVNVVWEDSTPGHYELYYRRSADGGSSWSSAKRLTWTSSSCRAPAMAIDGDNRIHVAWFEYTQGTISNIEIHYRRSTDGGLSWNPAQRLTWTAGNSYYPAMASDSNQNVRVVWYDDSSAADYEIYYKGSTDGGSAWTPAKRLTWNSGSSSYPAIAVDLDGIIHVVWWDSTPGNQQIYHTRSLDGGTTWSAARRLTWASGDCYSPAIAIDSNKVIHVAWYNVTSNDYEIFYKESTDGGLTWTSAQRLTWASGSSLDPAMAIDSANSIHIVWRDAAPGNYEIYYKKGN
jgi:BNR repeat-containing family member